MAQESFQINTEPHEATVGPHTFLFKPEVYSDEFLGAFADLRAKTAAADIDVERGPDGEVTPATAEQIRDRNLAVNEAAKAFVASLMLDDEDVEAVKARTEPPPPPGAAGATVFVATKLPDRVVLQLERWILGVYGLRPTGASSDSPAPSSSPAPGSDSTTGGPSADPTPSPGGPPAS